MWKDSNIPAQDMVEIKSMTGCKENIACAQVEQDIWRQVERKQVLLIDINVRDAGPRGTCDGITPGNRRQGYKL